MTREQIGTALGYSEPRKSIAKIHERNRERLDPLSVVVKLTSTDGKAYNTMVYNRKGVMEICRWSQQPKANDFMDWTWDVMDGLITGKLTPPPSATTVPAEFIQLTQEMCRLMGELVRILPGLVEAASANVSVSVPTPPPAVIQSSAPQLKMERFPPYVIEHVEQMFEDMLDHNTEKGHNRGLNFSEIVRYCESQGCKIGHHSVVAYFKKIYGLSGMDNWRWAQI